MRRDPTFGNPIIHREEDEFNRWPFARALADRIAGLGGAEGAPVVGLYGKWGYGKSSVLNLVKHRLEEAHSDRVVLFEFNPWLFNSHEELLAAFFTGLAKCLEQSLGSTTKDVGVLLKKYSGLLGMIPVVGSGAGKLAEQIGSELSGSLQDQRQDVFKMMRSTERTVVVLIDDLDRLDRNEIMTMLKLVRLTANVPRVVYLLAFDDEMVAHAVASSYGGIGDAGRQFLEKIVQFPFAIPAVGQERLVNYVLKHACNAADHAGVRLSCEEWSKLRELVDSCFSRRLTTPRQAIRYGSALNFALPMLKGEVDPLQQMVVEGLRILFPEIYEDLRDNSAFFTQSGFSEETVIQRVTEKLAMARAEDIRAAKELLLFLFERRYQEPAQPIRDPRYFHRHFSYALLGDEIPDSDILALIELAEADYDTLVAKIEQLAARNAPQLLDLLRLKREQLSQAPALGLARGLAACGRTFATSAPVEQSALAHKFAELLAELVKSARWPSEFDRAGAAERHQLAAEILDRLQPVPLKLVFMQELDRANIRNKQHAEANRITYEPVIGDEGWEMLRARLEPSLRTAANADPSGVFIRDSDGADLFRAWRSYSPKTLREWLGEQMERAPALSVLVLRHFLSEESDIALEMGIGWKYDFIAEVVSPAILEKALRTHLAAAQREDDDSSRRDALLSRIFLEAHEHRNSGSETAADK